MAPLITLLTDFGIRDGYVASMKGVILSICPQARMVDITHMIAPQDVRAGAFVLSTVYRDFPLETIHLAVVDPGVGTKRKALALQAGGYRFVGPDNGLFSWILEGEPSWKARSLENRRYWNPSRAELEEERASISTTFHGRDIFAPVAAHLARCVDLDDLGPSCTPVVAQWSTPTAKEEELLGEVIYVDHFGNGITNITREELETFAPRDQGERIIRVAGAKGEKTIKMARTYGDVAPGTSLALIGSSERLEIAVNQGDAAQTLGLRAGCAVSLRRSPSPRSS